MTTEKLPTSVRKEQIVEVVLQLLSNNSVKKLKVTDIARHMGLAPSALYRHFKNKDAMFGAVLEHIRTKLFLNLESARQKTDDAVERLHELLLHHTRLISLEQGIPRFFFSDELWGQKREKRQRMYRIVTGYLAEIEAIVKEGQERGHIRQGIKAQVVARMFFGIVQPAALLWHMSDGDYDVEGHAAAAWPIFLEIITR